MLRKLMRRYVRFYKMVKASGIIWDGHYGPVLRDMHASKQACI